MKFGDDPKCLLSCSHNKDYIKNNHAEKFTTVFGVTFIWLSLYHRILFNA